jgi:hypothetical protein
MAEVTGKTITQVAPNAGKGLLSIEAVTANATDIITVTGLTIVEGAYIVNAVGTTSNYTTVGTDNVVRLTNSPVGTVRGFVWGK